MASVTTYTCDQCNNIIGKGEDIFYIRCKVPSKYAAMDMWYITQEWCLDCAKKSGFLTVKDVSINS